MADTGASIKIGLDTAAAARLFARLKGAGADLSPPMRDIAGHLEEETRHRFETQTGPDGASARVGTNLDYAAIHQFGGTIEKAERQATIYHKVSALLNGDNRFVKKSKADFAQDVTIKAHSVSVPDRPYLGLSQSDNLMIADILNGHLRQAAGVLA